MDRALGVRNMQGTMSSQLRVPLRSQCANASARPAVTFREANRQGVNSGDWRKKAYRLQATATDVLEERKQLSAELLEALKQKDANMRTGKMSEEVAAIVDRIDRSAQAAPVSLAEVPEQVRGRFVGLLNTTNYLAADSSSTLGTLTFQQIGPTDLKVSVAGSDVLQGVDSPDQYITSTYFTVLEGQHKGLVGKQSAVGTYTLEEPERPERQTVQFTAIRIEPHNADSLERWVAAFKPANPSMDDRGCVTMAFPKPIKGTRDFILLDERVQVTRGNRGSLVIIRRAN